MHMHTFENDMPLWCVNISHQIRLPALFTTSTLLEAIAMAHCLERAVGKHDFQPRIHVL